MSTSPPTRRRRQTVADMVRSLALVLGGVLVLVLLFPRPSEPQHRPVDVAGAAEQAAAADAPVAVPSLPDGWSANSARFSPAEDSVPTWHVGYVTPSGGYAGLEMARDVTRGWLLATTSEGQEVGRRDVAGRPWRELLSPDGRRRSLVASTGGTTTVVTGTATLDELVLLAEAAAG